MTMLRPLAILSLLPILLLAAPASALTSKDKAETCKIGADAEKLAGAKRQAFIAQCMAQGDVTATAAKSAAPPSKLTYKQKLETCTIGADDQKLTAAARKTFLAKCMANEPHKKTATSKPTQLVPPAKPQ
jgi:hypothetical protein